MAQKNEGKWFQVWLVVLGVVLALLGAWAYDVWITGPKEKTQQEEGEADRKKSESAAKIEDRWRAIENRLNRLVQWIKGADEIEEKRDVDETNRVTMIEFVSSIQQTEHKKNWQRFLGDLFDPNSDIDVWERRMNKHEAVEKHSHGGQYTQWQMKYDWDFMSKTPTAQLVNFSRRFDALISGSSTIACANCAVATPDPSSKPNLKAFQVKGIIVKSVPLFIQKSYPVVNLESAEARLIFGDQLPKDTQGYFVPDIEIVPIENMAHFPEGD